METIRVRGQFLLPTGNPSGPCDIFMNTVGDGADVRDRTAVKGWAQVGIEWKSVPRGAAHVVALVQ